VLVLVNGLFYEERIIRETALARGIRVVTYEVGAQAGTLHFSDRHPAVDYDIGDLWEQAGDQPLDAAAERDLETLLEGRRTGSGLAHRYYRRRKWIATRKETPLVAVFTNVSWDTAATGQAPAFESMFDWVAETVRVAQEHPAIGFILRAHPAESRWPGFQSRERLTDFLKRSFTSLPDNVRVVPPDEAIDSYALIDAADVVVVFSSTVGLEAAALGKPVCVAGRTHYGRHGFTIDVTTTEAYHTLFDDLSWAQTSPKRQQLARRYAYLFFVRSMIPFHAVVEKEPSEPVFMFEHVSELRPGCDPDLDLVCDGILAGGPIRLP
jgi:hypothetical protein